MTAQEPKNRIFVVLDTPNVERAARRIVGELAEAEEAAERRA